MFITLTVVLHNEHDENELSELSERKQRININYIKEYFKCSECPYTHLRIADSGTSILGDNPDQRVVIESPEEIDKLIMIAQVTSATQPRMRINEN